MTDQKAKYLVAGVWNTVFGYCVAISMYELLSNFFGIVAIGILINLITITSAFLVFKIFVFRSKGEWIFEYLRCILVYGWSAILGVFLLWLLVKNIGVKFFIAQAIITIITIILSYSLHNKFTFKNEKN